MQSFLRRKFVRDTLALQIGKVGVTGFAVLSSALIFRLLGPQNYGIWSLAWSFFSIAQALDLSGTDISTSTRLAMAVGAKDERLILDLMAFYVKVSSAVAVVGTALLAVLGPPIARLAYSGDPRIGVLAAWVSITVLTDAYYNLVVISLQSRRLMRSLALLQNINQAMLVGCVAVTLVISPTPEGMVAARLAYSASTMLVALAFYVRLRLAGPVAFPSLGAVAARVRAVPVRPYWRFGVLNAVDKNVTNLYTEIPVQLLGILAGGAAAGYLELGMKAMTVPNLLTSAVFDNLQAVVPQAVGRGDFARLWANLLRVMGALALAAVGFYTAFVLAVPLVVPLIYGGQAVPAVPVIQVLAVYGAATMIGGIFGPLYRALYLLRSIILVKVASLLLMLLPGVVLAANAGATGGAWMLNGLYVTSIALTAVVTLPALRRKAAQPAAAGG
jgi:O-antigen/teichoic acid export membrane protein